MRTGLISNPIFSGLIFSVLFYSSLTGQASLPYDSTLNISDTTNYREENTDYHGKDSIGETTGKEPGKSPLLKPLSFKIGSTSYKFKFGGRIQPRFDYYPSKLNDTGESKIYFRRIRFKSQGHLFTPSLEYKLEIDLLKFQILDLVVNWQLGDHFRIGAGLTKLKGNRERVISSQNLQFVDRSLLNSKFTLDRDLGIWITHERMYGDFAIRTILSVTKGEGIDYIFNDPQFVKNGLDYTGRIELLPLGYFSGNGDYSGSDLAREKSPKLALGFTYDFNNNAVRSNGQKGDILDIHGDLGSYFIDAMFKYNGISWMSEYVNRSLYRDYSELTASEVIERNKFYAGKALNTQIGYLFLSNFEIASRYTRVIPNENTGKNILTEYTMGISKYIKGHKLKVQTDLSLLKEETENDRYKIRIQIELSL